MVRRKTMTNKIARIENFFVENAQYSLSAREQKIILHLISNLDVKSDNFNEQVVTVKEIEQVLKKSKSKWGGIYKEMTTFAEQIAGKTIKFPSDVMLNGERMPGFITWFSTITPCYNEHEEICMKFRFNSDLKPLLLNLNQYVRIQMNEVLELQSSYSIRLFSIFKMELAKHSKHTRIVTKTFALTELHNIFQLKDKWKEFKYFKRDVLTKAVDEINEKTSIFLKCKTLRTKRKITHLEFTFCLKADNIEYSQLSFFDSNPIEAPNLSPEQRKAKAMKFDFKSFKKLYAGKYKSIIDDVRESEMMMHMKGTPNYDTVLEQSIKNACQTWWVEYGGETKSECKQG
jgi:plasmid replication initiation protein